MALPAVRVENLSKRYRIGARETQKTFREAIVDLAVSPIRRLRSFGRSSHREDDSIWALEDVSFEVQPGEVVGIVGQNGAGKSTLLKILARITEPTAGRARLRGRVASLLEVGTGFHRELTGRENVYLSGAILGMTKKEIVEKFDEIVDFSGIEKFIDTPVKRYSTGMRVRLGFAVAAHLEPEILLIDEVLAVGDVAFQKKCLGKMEQVGQSGRTVLFISHNLNSVMSLCPRSLLLTNGSLSASGSSADVIESYLSLLDAKGEARIERPTDRKGDGRLRFTEVRLEDDSGRQIAHALAGTKVKVVMEFDCNDELPSVRFVLTIYNHLGIAVTQCSTDAHGSRYTLSRGSGRAICEIPRLPLPRGTYRIATAAYDGRSSLDGISIPGALSVPAGGYFDTPYLPRVEYCTALIEHNWEVSTGDRADHADLL